MARLTSRRIEELKEEIRRKKSNPKSKAVLKWLKEHPIEWNELEEKAWKKKYNPSRRDAGFQEMIKCPKCRKEIFPTGKRWINDRGAEYTEYQCPNCDENPSRRKKGKHHKLTCREGLQINSNCHNKLHKKKRNKI